MKIKPYIIAGVGGNPLKTYFIREGNAEIETKPGGRSSISLAGADIVREKSFKSLLGLGTIKITSAGGSVQEWTNVPNVDKVYEALLRASKGLPPEDSESEKANKLKLAKKTHKTDFGDYENNSAMVEDTKIETPVGTYILHNNGTFSDVANQLMWIQAPWGMIWGGSEFKGEPIGLYWKEATKLFGKSVEIPHPGGGLHREIIEAFGLPDTYKNGTCVVTFAGYSDWRLPTAKELLTIKFYDYSLGESSGYDYWSSENTKRLREKLLPTIESDLKRKNASDFWSWSANDRGDETAWASDGRGSVGDTKKKREGYILLVRDF